MLNGTRGTVAGAPATISFVSCPPAARTVVRVAVVDHDPVLRRSLAARIGSAPGQVCVGQYLSVDHAMRGLAGATADVLLLDGHLAEESAIDGIRRIRASHPRTSVLVLTDSVDRQRVIRFLGGGAVGCLLKSITPARLVLAIEDTAAGGSPLSPEIARAVVGLFQRTGAPGVVRTSLTPQEIRLLALLARGLTYQAAGDHLCVSVNTVRNYIRSIYEKLQVHSKSEAVAKAFRQGLI
jgi:DNA-binding NarL/FixJ family response regulator